MAGAEESLRNAASKLAGLVRGREKAPEVQSATVTRVDDDGTVWVAIAGSSTETPVRAGMAAGVGDKVSVRLAGGSAVLTDNVSRPATDDSLALQARFTALDAQDAADMAAEVAGAIGQHFWTDEAGVHVSNEEGKADGSRNSIFNSLGLIFREGANYLMGLVSGSAVGAAESDRGMAIFDGLGNAASNVIAWFGRNGIRIGKANAQHVEITAQGISITNGSTAGTVNGVDVVQTNATANAARSTANSAASAASAAQSTANGAATAASNAQTTANGAATAASNAQSTADAALRMAADSADNMLTDWNAPSLAKADGPAARYFSDNSANRTVEYIQVSDPPEPGIAYGARVTSQGAQANNTTKSAVCFYASNTNVAMSDGQSYTVSFWARCTSGACAYYCQVGSSPYAQKNGSNAYSNENALGAQWQRIEWTFQYTAAGMGGGGGGCRIYCGIVFKASTAGVGEVCGFRLVPGISGGTAADAAAEAQALAATADGKANKTKENFWADSGGVHVSTQASTAAGTYNSLFASTGLLFRNAANTLVSLTKSALNFYDGTGNAEANVTASYGADSVRIGKLADYHYYGTATSLGLYPGGNNTANNALLYANSTPSVRIGAYASPHVYISSTAMSFNVASSNAQGASDSNSWFLVNNTPEMRMGKFNQPHLHMNATSLGFYPASAAHATTAANANTGASLLSVSSTPAVRIGAYASPHAYIDSSSFGFYPASSNAAANAYTYISAGSIRLGQQAANVDNMLIDSDGMHFRINSSSFADFTYEANSMSVPIDASMEAVGVDTLWINAKSTTSDSAGGAYLGAEDIISLRQGGLGHSGVSGLSLVGAMAYLYSASTNIEVGDGVVNITHPSLVSKRAVLKVEGTEVSLSGHTHSYLPLAGGTLTGHLSFKDPNIDRDAAAPSAAQVGRSIIFNDKNGERIGVVRADREASGVTWLKFAAFSENSSGTEQSTWMQVGVNNAGVKGVYLSDPQPFRAALGLDSPSSAVTTIASVIAAGTNVTIKSVRYQTFGKVATVSISFTKSTATPAGGGFNMGTIVAGKRPATEANCGSNAYCGHVGTQGQVHVRNIMGAQIAADTELHVNATYILP